MSVVPGGQITISLFPEFSDVSVLGLVKMNPTHLYSLSCTIFSLIFSFFMRKSTIILKKKGIGNEIGTNGTEIDLYMQSTACYSNSDIRKLLMLGNTHTT